MPAMRKSQKEANEAALTLEGWFVGYSSEQLVDAVRLSYGRGNKREILRCLSVLRVDNCGVSDYELAEMVEDAIYKIEYGVFWKLISPGRYLLDRKSAFNMRAIVDHKQIPFPDWQEVEHLRATDASPREASEN